MSRPRIRSDKALSIAEQLLQAHPDLGGFYGVTGSGVPGAAGAVKQANKCGQVKVGGFDVVPRASNSCAPAAWTSWFPSARIGMTAQALQILVDLSKGGPSESTNVDTGVEMVYPDTLEEFLTTSH